jgi:hypothetical protein
MHRFVLGWKKLGHEKRLKAYIVNYADDLVICCRGQAEQALATMRDMMSKLKLTVNDTKTRVCKLPEEKFDFLGYSFGRCYSPKTGRAYIGTTPSKKRVQRICQAISAATRRSQLSRRPSSWWNNSTDKSSDGPTTSVWVLSAKPTPQWKNTLAEGFAIGCAPNINGREPVASGTPTSSCTIRLG